MMKLSEACNILHVDQGSNDLMIKSLISALPGYIEMATGMSEDDQDDEPLVKVVEGFLLTQWYYSDHADDQSHTRTIDSLLKAITLKAKS